MRVFGKHPFDHLMILRPKDEELLLIRLLAKIVVSCVYPIFLLLNRLDPVMMRVAVGLTEGLAAFDYIQNVICFLFIFLFRIGVQVSWRDRGSCREQNVFILSI